MPFSTPTDFAKATAELKRLGPSAIQNSRALLTYLRLLRELGVTDPEGVLEYGSAVLTKFQGKLSMDERWQLHEEVAIAAFSCGQHDVGAEILKKLQKQFKESSRVECLRGMAYESIGNLDEAEIIYDKIIASKPTFPDALKRKIGLNVTRGNITEAMAAASEYLNIYQTDAVVWEQLHSLHVQAGNYAQAQYCLEEVMLHNPGNCANMLRLADLHYAQGGVQHFKAAHRYYARVLELTQADNVRALYGVIAAKDALGASGKGDMAKSELSSLSRERLLQLYEQSAASKVELMESVLPQEA